MPNSLRWRHNGRDSVSNHQHHHCLLNRLFRRRSTKSSKLRVTGLRVGNAPGTGEFPSQMAIWWRHHVLQAIHIELSAVSLIRPHGSPRKAQYVLCWLNACLKICFPNVIMYALPWYIGLHYWPFVMGIYRWLVDSPDKGQLRGNRFYVMTSSCTDVIN